MAAVADGDERHQSSSSRTSLGSSPTAGAVAQQSQFVEVTGCILIEYSVYSAPRVAQTICWSLSSDLKNWLSEFLTKELLHVAESKHDSFAVRLMSLEEACLSAIVATFTYEDVASFTACITFRFSRKRRLDAIFTSIRDYLERIYHRIRESEEDIVVVKEWSSCLDLFLPIVDRWCRAFIARDRLSLDKTFLVNRVTAPPSLSTVVSCCAAHHRCIIRGNDVAVVEAWLQTVAYFMLDDRLAFATTSVGATVQEIVPDLSLQGTTAQITQEFLTQLYNFQYPCCVVDVSRPPDVAAHYVPHAQLNKYSEERWKLLVNDVPVKEAQVLSQIRVRSPIIASVCHRVERSNMPHALLEATMTLWRRNLVMRALANYVREVDLKDANLQSAAIPAIKLEEADNQVLAVAIEHIYPLQKATEKRLAAIVVEAFQF